jgi:Tol biopolymer transport system component
VLLYHVGPKLYSIRLGDPRAQPQFLTDAVNARFSPDSRWIVYSAITNEVREIYALPYPAGGLPTQLSPAGGVYPVWRSDGEEILYVSGSTVCSVRVQAKGGTLHASQPERLFDIRNPAGLAADSTPLAVTHDGSRILFAQGIEPAGSQQTYVMTSWESVLRR